MPGTIIRTSGVITRGATVGDAVVTILGATVDAAVDVTRATIATIFPTTCPHRNAPRRSASSAFNTPAGTRRTQHCDPHSNNRHDDQQRHHDGERNDLRRRHEYYLTSPLAWPWFATAAAPASAASGSR